MNERLECVTCGKRYPVDKVRYTCDCGGLLNFERDTPRVGRELFDERRATARTPVDQSGVWRFREALMDVDLSAIVTHPEGSTRLYERGGICVQARG